MLLGIVQNISTLTAMLDMFVYDDGIAVCRGASVKNLVRRVGGEFLGGHLEGQAGFEAAVGASNMRDRERIGPAIDDRDALLSRHPKNRFIPAASIAAARLKGRWDGSTRLELDLADGTHQSFTWKKIYGNDPGEVRRMLTACLGSRLSTPFR